ncbi:MAG: bacillithiol biosynthesis BshC [Vicinamibacterales bacterium]
MDRIRARSAGPGGLRLFRPGGQAARPRHLHQGDRRTGTDGGTGQRSRQHLITRGVHAQVTPAEGAISLFHLDANRESIKAVNGRVAIGGRELTLQELAAEAQARPEHFSPNVLLRPVVQDAVFPTICYVAGPNELAYLGQLRAVYAHFGIAMPLIYQRATATLADSATLRFLNRYTLELTTLQQQDERVLNALLEAQLPPTVEQALSSVAAQIDERMAALADVVPQIDQTLSGTVKTTLGKMQHEMHTLHNKVIQAAKRKDETLRRQFTRARALTFPNGHPQEREIGFVWFLNRYGPALVTRLAQDIPLGMGHHYVLTI